MQSANMLCTTANNRANAPATSPVNNTATVAEFSIPKNRLYRIAYVACWFLTILNFILLFANDLASRSFAVSANDLASSLANGSAFAFSLATGPANHLASGPASTVCYSIKYTILYNTILYYTTLH